MLALMSAAPGREPTSMAYPVGAPPVAGGFHSRVTRVPAMSTFGLDGAPGGTGDGVGDEQARVPGRFWLSAGHAFPPPTGSVRTVRTHLSDRVCRPPEQAPHEPAP